MYQARAISDSVSHGLHLLHRDFRPPHEIDNTFPSQTIMNEDLGDSSHHTESNVRRVRTQVQKTEHTAVDPLLTFSCLLYASLSNYVAVRLLFFVHLLTRSVTRRQHESPT